MTSFPKAWRIPSLLHGIGCKVEIIELPQAWLLEGRPVLALTAATADNREPYRQHHNVSAVQQAELWAGRLAG
jgi:hypothetical protein